MENLERIIAILKKAEEDIYNLFDINNNPINVPVKEQLVTIVGNKGKRCKIGKLGRETEKGFVVENTYDLERGRFEGTDHRDKSQYHLENPTPEECALYLSQLN